MMRRCNDVTRKDYKHYGGRGISVCDRWSCDDGCKNFIEDMFPTFKNGLEIERVDVNGNYEPSNCTWVTRRDQVINRRPFGSCFDTRLIEYNGETLCLSQWSEKLNIDYRILIDRLGKLKWTVEKAFSEPYRPKAVYFEINGISYKTREVFKNPPNVFTLAKNQNLSFHQFIANVFDKILTVRVKIAKESVAVKPTVNMSQFLNKIKFNSEFLEVLNTISNTEFNHEIQTKAERPKSSATTASTI